MPSSTTTSFDVFVSYSRKDAQFVQALRTSLERYRAPRALRVPHRRLRVFVDTEDFQTGEYDQRLVEYLRTSSKLIVICSPSARLSSFVSEEIARFAELHGVQNLIPVLIAGLPNNEVTPASESEQAFPDALCKLMEMPVAVDYRAFVLGTDRVDRRHLRAPWFTLLAAVLDRSRAEVELREHNRRKRRIQLSAAIAALTLASAGFTARVVVPRYRVASALADISRAGGQVTDEKGLVSIVFESGAKAPNVDAALIKLRALPRVDRVDLAETSFTSAGILALGAVRGLWDLTVATTSATDQDMASISELRNLKKLQIYGTRITTAGLRQLGSLSSLEYLDVDDLNINDASVLSALSSLKSLRILHASYSGIDDSDLAFVEPLTRLQELYLSGNKIEGHGAVHFEPLRELAVLEIDNSSFVDANLHHLAKLPALRSLSLEEADIKGTGIKDLSGARKLEVLNLTNNPAITDSAVRQLKLPQLREIWLKNTAVSDDSLRHLSTFQGLQIISVPVTKVSDKGLAHLVGLADLRELYLGGDAITDVGVESLVQIKSLRSLALPDAQLTDKSLPLFTGLQNLRELSVGGPGVTKAGFERLKRSLPKVRVVLNERL